MPRPSSPTSHAAGAVELDLARGVGAVAELVLQALDADRVARAVGQQARHEEARQARRRSGRAPGCASHMRRREEPLVAGEPVRSPQPAPPIGSARVVLARTSEPPCFSVMPMPISTPRLCRDRQRARVVVARQQLGQPSAASAGCAAQHRHDGEGHRRSGTACRFRPATTACTWPRARPVRRAAARPRARHAAPLAISCASARCQAGWNSTSSMRAPKRSCVCSAASSRSPRARATAARPCPIRRRARAALRRPSPHRRRRAPRRAAHRSANRLRFSNGCGYARWFANDPPKGAPRLMPSCAGMDGTNDRRLDRALLGAARRGGPAC